MNGKIRQDSMLWINLKKIFRGRDSIILYRKASYTLIAKYAKMGVKCEKWKVYGGVFRATFLHFAPLFSLFVPGSAFVRKLRRFHGLFFHSIKEAWNSHEMRRVHSECFVFCGVFREKHSWNAKYEKCIAGQMSEGLWEIVCKIFKTFELEFLKSSYILMR